MKNYWEFWECIQISTKKIIMMFYVCANCLIFKRKKQLKQYYSQKKCVKNIKKIKMNKKDLKTLEQLKKNLSVITKAENVVVEHLFKRNLSKDILLRSYGTIKEKNGWIEINATTNKHSHLFNIQAVKLENGDEDDLRNNIE